MDGMLLLAGGASLVASLGYFESFLHRRNLRKIPIRIHVNGTRGKSSVTRLIAAGLRAGGVRTCAKTTGTLPRMIFPDGTEYPIFRPARSNIIEQRRVVRAAAANGVDALVVECMALQPALQSLCELKFVQSTHGVITNARADHLDVMGPTVRDVAKALAGAAPVNGRLYTAETRYRDVFETAARDRGSRLIAVENEIEGISAAEMEGFSHIEHRDNVALALRVCADVGVDRATALRGMWEASPDPGVMSLYQVDELDQHIVFVNGFAANDPESTGASWNMLVHRFEGVERRIALFNCRADRPERTVQLADACVHWRPADHYVVVGSATDVFARRAAHVGLARDRITCVENPQRTQLLDVLGRQAGRSAFIMGMGNIYGPGLDVVDYFRNRSLCLRAKTPAMPQPATTLLQEAA